MAFLRNSIATFYFLFYWYDAYFKMLYCFGLRGGFEDVFGYNRVLLFCIVVKDGFKMAGGKQVGTKS